MKKNLLLVLIFCLAVSTGAISAPQGNGNGNDAETVTFRFVPGTDMFYVPWQENGEELTRLYGAIDRFRNEIRSGEMPVYVNGYSGSMRDHNANVRLAFVRANRVKSELITHKGLIEDNFITRNYPTAYTDADGISHKDIVVVTIRIPAKPAPMAEPEPEPAPVKEVEPLPAEEPPFVVVDPQPEPVAEPVTAKKCGLYGFDIRTNLLYDALLTPTLGFEMRFNKHWGIKVDGSYAHWGSEKGRVQKIWMVSPEIRWYLLQSKRMYLGVAANIGEFNIYKGMARIVSKDTGYQGNLYGGGVTVGYRLPMGKCMAFDFNLGLGLTHVKYDSFTVSNEVRVYKDQNRNKNLWGPTQAGVSLIWNIGGNK